MSRRAPTRPRLTPRRRPRSALAQTTVTALLDTVAELLPRTGASGLRTAAIVDRSGVAVGSFYEYFPTVASAVVAVGERELRRAEEAATRRLLRGADLADAVVDGLLRATLDRPVLAGALAAAAGTWGIGPRLDRCAAELGGRLAEVARVAPQRAELAVIVVRAALAWAVQRAPSELQDDAFRARLVAMARAAA